MHGRVVVGGDVNIDVTQPRDAADAEAAAALHLILSRWGVTHIPGEAPTHRGTHGDNRIDLIAAAG
eukprot:11159692-Lingulodinium_polyedra.AAC.1